MSSPLLSSSSSRLTIMASLTRPPRIVLSYINYTRQTRFSVASSWWSVPTSCRIQAIIPNPKHTQIPHTELAPAQQSTVHKPEEPVPNALDFGLVSQKHIYRIHINANIRYTQMYFKWEHKANTSANITAITIKVHTNLQFTNRTANTHHRRLFDGGLFG